MLVDMATASDPVTHHAHKVTKIDAVRQSRFQAAADAPILHPITLLADLQVLQRAVGEIWTRAL